MALLRIFTETDASKSQYYDRMRRQHEADEKFCEILLISLAVVGLLGAAGMAYEKRHTIKVYVLANKVKVFVAVAFVVIGTAVACSLFGKEVVLLTYEVVIGFPATLVGSLFIAVIGKRRL